MEITFILYNYQVFDEAQELGFTPDLLDIGGGFPGTRNSTLDEIAEYVNNALDEHFPESCGVKVGCVDGVGLVGVGG